MAYEIERKFLVKNDSFIAQSFQKSVIKQGYISTNENAVVRVRTKDNKAFITIKGINSGASRQEWEYPIPLTDAEDMLNNLCSNNIISKTRYYVKHDNHLWEIDVFDGRHNGLIIAEIELSSEDETFSIPSFIGDEVTGNIRYYNSELSKSTFQP